MSVITLRLMCAVLLLEINHVIDPYFFAERTVTSHNYLNMLELFAVPEVDDNVILQQDGAPVHYANSVTEFLDETFPWHWIGRGGWKERAPMLSGPDTPGFCFWVT
jgi:hypothetical protein